MSHVPITPWICPECSRHYQVGEFPPLNGAPTRPCVLVPDSGKGMRTKAGSCCIRNLPESKITAFGDAVLVGRAFRLWIPAVRHSVVATEVDFG